MIYCLFSLIVCLISIFINIVIIVYMFIFNFLILILILVIQIMKKLLSYCRIYFDFLIS